LPFSLQPLLLLDDFNIERIRENGSYPGEIVELCEKIIVINVPFPLKIGEMERKVSRSPESCMLENIKTSPPNDFTSSTNFTNFFRRLKSLDLNNIQSIFELARTLEKTSGYLNRLSEMSRVPTAPRSAALSTWSSPYHARSSSDASILLNLQIHFYSTRVKEREKRRGKNALVKHEAFACKLSVLELVCGLGRSNTVYLRPQIVHRREREIKRS
jgi:hypothetical protein